MVGRSAWVLADAALLGFLVWLWHVDIPPPPIRISIANSIGKQAWLHQAVQEFNAESAGDVAYQVDRRPVQVEIIQESVAGQTQDYRSGTMVKDTVAGKIQPTILSPAGDFWIAKLQKEWRDRFDGEVTSDVGPALARTPLVVAMWSSRVQALGCWPIAQPECAWPRIVALAKAPDGWGMLGRPEWGQLKLGYAYLPEDSPATAATVLICMSGAGKPSGLAVLDVDVDSACGQSMAAVEDAKTHSGTTSIALLQDMPTRHPPNLDGVFLYESDVVGSNQRLAQPLADPIVSVYPQDGNFLESHPFTVLDGAPWVNMQQVAAAKVFLRFLLSRDQQLKVLATGLRPADPSVPLGPPIDQGHGASPNVSLLALEMPERLVVDRITEVWQRVRKHTIVALVFDKSSTMVGPKLAAAIQGAQEFVATMDRDDSVIWMPFDTEVAPPIESPPDHELSQRIGETTAGGETALYDAVLAARAELQSRRAIFGATRRYGLVVLSDGRDSVSKSTQALLELALQPEESDPNGIQMHTIATSDDVDEVVLREIAKAGNGTFTRATTAADLVKVYSEIAKYY